MNTDAYFVLETRQHGDTVEVKDVDWLLCELSVCAISPTLDRVVGRLSYKKAIVSQGVSIAHSIQPTSVVPSNVWSKLKSLE
jgi:hypothetical protein